MLLNRGEHKEGRILSEASIDQMMRKWIEIPESDGSNSKDLSGCYYGFACFVLQNPELDRGNSKRACSVGRATTTLIFGSNLRKTFTDYS